MGGDLLHERVNVTGRQCGQWALLQYSRHSQRVWTSGVHLQIVIFEVKNQVDVIVAYRCNAPMHVLQGKENLARGSSNHQCQARRVQNESDEGVVTCEPRTDAR